MKCTETASRYRRTGRGAGLWKGSKSSYTEGSKEVEVRRSGECVAALSLERLKHTPAFIAPLRSSFLSTKKPVCLSNSLMSFVGPSSRSHWSGHTLWHPSLLPSSHPCSLLLTTRKNLCSALPPPPTLHWAGSWLMPSLWLPILAFSEQHQCPLLPTSLPTNRKT